MIKLIVSDVELTGETVWFDQVIDLRNVKLKDPIYSEIYAETKLKWRIDDGPLRNLKLV